MLAINDEQRALGGLQYGTADWSDKFLEVLTVVGADDQQLCRSVVLSQIVQKAAAHGHPVHPKIWIASPPTGQPTIVADHFVITRPSPIANNRLNGGTTQPGYLDGGAQQHAVVTRRVYFDDNPVRGQSGLVVVVANNGHRALRRDG